MADEIPKYKFTLNNAKLDGDFSSMATIHNNNMEEIVKWVNAIVGKMDTLDSGNQTLTNAYFETLLTQNRVVFSVEENIQTSDAIINDGYRLTRRNNPDGSSELIITDEDGKRATNFRLKQISVMDNNGVYLYPHIRTDLTMAIISFDDGTFLNKSDNNKSNKKYILIS